MRDAANALNWATDAAFVLLAIASIRQYLRHPQRHRLDLAVAILILTVVAALGRLSPLLPKGAAGVVGYVSIALLLASGELPRQVVHAIAQAHQFERGGGVFQAFLLLQVRQLQG